MTPTLPIPAAEYPRVTTTTGFQAADRLVLIARRMDRGETVSGFDVREIAAIVRAMAEDREDIGRVRR